MPQAAAAAGPLAAGALALAMAACVFDHGAAREYESIREPFGDTVRFTYRVPEAAGWQVLRGELLEVRDGGVLVATDSGFVRLPVTNIIRPGFESLDALRTGARYPYGLTDDQLRRLLRAAGLQRVDTVRMIPDTPPEPGADLAAFLEEAREATAPYATLGAAIAAGYRRLGPSFPGMGEHWIHPGLIVEGRVRADRPPVLCYVRVGEEPRLVGLAYAVPLEPGELPPAHPAGRDVWHDHGERIDEEVLLLVGPPSHRAGEGAGHGAENGHEAAPRLAMFHAWVWLDNPDGVLTQNNWRIPFLQAGVDVGSLRPSADAARGLSLHTAGPAYYLELFRLAAAPDPLDDAAFRRILEPRARTAANWAGRARAGEVDEARLRELEALWHALWQDIAAAAPGAVGGRLAALR